MAASSHLSRVCPLVRFKVIETKNPSNTNKKQNQKIAALERKVAMIKLTNAMPKKAARAYRKRARSQRPKVATPLDPVAVSVKAMVKPFDVPKGIASNLYNPRPSQKFMAKANTSVSIPAGCTMVFMCSPCVASDSNRPSVTVAIQSASATPFSGAWKNAVVGGNVVGGGTISTLSTNTPYSAATLAGTGYEWNLVGVGLRFTYEGTELNRGGMFRYVHDLEGGYNQGNSDWTVKGPGDIVTFVDSATNNLRQSINKNNVVEINPLVIQHTYFTGEGSSIFSNSSGAPIGGSVPVNAVGTVPMCLGYFVNVSTTTVAFHVETVEHWSVSSPALQALHTASVGHPVLHEQVGNFLHTARQLHASQPNAHHVDVMKEAKKSLGSPLGHELLNTALTAALA